MLIQNIFNDAILIAEQFASNNLKNSRNMSN